MPIFNERGESVEPVNFDSLNEDFTATDDDTSGGNGQEVAEPASEPETDADTDGEVTNPEEEVEPSESSVVSEEDGAGVQSKAENRRQAAARREREAAEARTAAQDEVVKAMGIFNPATGKNCETYEEYNAMKNSSAQSKIREQLEKQGVDTSAIDKLIDEHPAVKEAKQVVESAKAAEAEAKRATDNAKFKKLLEDVSSAVPEIKSSDDLFKWEHFNKFSILVNGGISPLEAAETLAGNSRAKAAKQATLNKIASKAHLTSTKTTNSGGDYNISDAEYAAFLEFNPGVSREAAAAAYKKFGGKKK